MPEKAKLVTRSTATSSVTADNLNKGSALEFAELDSSLINLRDQTFGIVGDDSSTIDVGAGDTLYIQGGTNVTTETDSSGALIINASSGGSLGNVSGSGNVLSSSGGAIEISTGSSTGDLTLRTANAASDIFLITEDIVVGDSSETAVLLRAESTSQTFTINNNWANTGLVFNTNGSIDLKSLADRDITIKSLGGSGDIILDAITVHDNKISTNASNANLELDANGSGKVSIAGLLYPTSDGSSNQVLKTDGSGTLSFADASGGASTGDITFNGSTISSPSNGDLTLDPSGTGDIILSVDGSTPSSVKVGNGSAYGSITSNGDQQLEVSANGGGSAQARIILQNDNGGRHVDLDPGTSGTIRLLGTTTVTGNITATTSIGNDAITIDDNVIATTRSNDTLYIEANGTGRVNVSGNGVKLENSTYDAVFGNASRIKGSALVYEDLAVNPNNLSDREYGHAIFQGTKITASGDNNNFRPRNLLCASQVDLNGFNYTRDSRYRGPLGAMIYASISNNTSTNAAINSVRGAETSASVQDYTSSSGDITITHAIGSFAANYFDRNGAGDINITNNYSYYSAPEANDSGDAGETTVTNHYGFYNAATAGNGTFTNAYAFFDAANALSQFGSMKLNTGATVTGILDEDNMGTNSPTQLATQQSIKAYVYANAGGGASRVIIGDGFTANTVALTDGTNILEGAWVEKTDADGVASVSGNTFTLAAGTYFLDFKAPQLFGTATGANEQSVPIFYLNNDTDSSIVAGSPDNIKFSGPSAGAIRLVGKVDFAAYFTIGAQKTFSIKYVQANATNAKFALGEGSWGQKTQFWIRVEKF